MLEDIVTVISLKFVQHEGVVVVVLPTALLLTETKAIRSFFCVNRFISLHKSTSNRSIGKNIQFEAAQVFSAVHTTVMNNLFGFLETSLTISRTHTTSWRGCIRHKYCQYFYF